MSGVELLEHRVGEVERAVSDIRDAVHSISEAVQAIAALEERHAETTRALGRAFTAIQDVDTRVRAIEVVLPGLKEIRRWVIAAVLGIVGLVGVGLIGVVVVLPRAYAVAPVFP